MSSATTDAGEALRRARELIAAHKSFDMSGEIWNDSDHQDALEVIALIDAALSATDAAAILPDGFCPKCGAEVLKSKGMRCDNCANRRSGGHEVT